MKEHQNLASLLKNIRGKFMLSYNDCELVRKLYKGFNFKELKVKYSLNASKTRKESKELLIMNF